MNLKQLLLSAALIVTTTAIAKDEFSALEQQQISIETPGLFTHSEAFTIDFASFRPSEYSFPLPIGKAKILHDYNVEITTKKGDAVKAMFSGIVRVSRSHPQFGNVIVIRHDNGLETVYGNNAQNLIKVGERVKAGQTIAIVGTEKGKTFCTFAIMINGGRVNPNTILNMSTHRLHRQTIMCRRAIGHVDLSVVESGNRLKKGEDNKGIEDIPEKLLEKSGEFSINFANFSPSEWSYPLENAKVISPYGRRGGRNHTGVDLKTCANDNIRSAFEGKVTRSGRFAGYGNVIVIKHASGIETWYSHNSKNLVKVGDWVKAGQVIALTGRTGRATTEHLHFECRVNGRPINPNIIFDHGLHSLKMNKLTFRSRRGGVSVSSQGSYMAKGK